MFVIKRISQSLDHTSTPVRKSLQPFLSKSAKVVKECILFLNVLFINSRHQTGAGGPMRNKKVALALSNCQERKRVLLTTNRLHNIFGLSLREEPSTFTQSRPLFFIIKTSLLKELGASLYCIKNTNF